MAEGTGMIPYSSHKSLKISICLVACVFTVYLAVVSRFQFSILKVIQPLADLLGARVRTEADSYFGLTKFPDWAVAEMILCALLFWRATLWEKSIGKLAMDFIWDLSILFVLLLCTLLWSFNLSFVVVVILTIVLAKEIVKVADEKARGKNIHLDRKTLWGGSLAFASGLVCTAGSIPPLDFALPLHEYAAVRWYLDIRLAMTGTFLSVFFVTVFVTALYRLRTQSKIELAVVEEVASTIPHTNNPFLQVLVQNPVLLYSGVVGVKHRVLFVLRESARMIRDVIFTNQLWNIIVCRVVPQIGGLLLLGLISFWASPKLIEFWNIESSSSQYPPIAEYILLAWCVLYLTVATFAINVIARTIPVKDVEKFFQYFYGPKMTTFLGSCWIVGLGFFLAKKSGVIDIHGFDHIGAYWMTITIFTLLTVPIFSIVRWVKKSGQP